MAEPTALALHSYTGFLVLDDQHRISALRWTDVDGRSNQIVMMLDPSPTGAFDPAEVNDAHDYFSRKPGVVDGSIITVVGFVAVPPNATEPFLHVVRG